MIDWQRQIKRNGEKSLASVTRRPVAGKKRVNKEVPEGWPHHLPLALVISGQSSCQFNPLMRIAKGRDPKQYGTRSWVMGDGMNVDLKQSSSVYRSFRSMIIKKNRSKFRG